MTRTVINLDTGAEYIFTAKTAYEAMRKMIYTLNIRREQIFTSQTERMKVCCALVRKANYK